MDDLTTGGDNIKKVAQIQKQISKIMKSVGFNLRNRASNCDQLMPSEPNGSVRINFFEK